MPVDYWIRGGTVVDGTGNSRFESDLLIQGDKILAVGKVEPGECRRTIDASGLVIAPGFIDIHTHADLELLANPGIEPKVMQGVTTEVFSNCGLGFAPVSSRKALESQRDHLRGIFGSPEGIDWGWLTTAEFLQRFTENVSVNVAYLVPHGALRVSAMGWQNRPATHDEVHGMNHYLSEALEAGACGLSTGLYYHPMDSATTEECASLCRTVEKAGGFLAIHLRDYNEHLLKSVEEAFEISRRSQVPLQLSHLQAPGRLNRGRQMGERLMQAVEEARQSGLDVLCDLYPYTAGCSQLASLLPAWATNGTVQETLSYLKDSHRLPEIQQFIEELGSAVDFSQMFLCGFRKGKCLSFDGNSVTEIARRAKKSVGEVVCQLLLDEELQVSYVAHQACEEDLRTILSHCTLMIGSDAVHIEGRLHPRVYGTYPRILDHYVRQKKLFSLEEAVRKMSSMPADRLGLKGRGYIRPGYWADLVLFNPEDVRDKATYERPRQFPEGIPYVFVNGVPVKADDEHTGARPGRVLRRGD